MGKKSPSEKNLLSTTPAVYTSGLHLPLHQSSTVYTSQQHQPFTPAVIFKYLATVLHEYYVWKKSNLLEKIIFRTKD